MARSTDRPRANRYGGLFWPNYQQCSLVLQNLDGLAEREHKLEWQTFLPGVHIHWLYRHSRHGPAAAFIRFQPGGSVPLHEHRGFEHILVLRGSQKDENGHLRAGGFMVHAPGTRHSVTSEEGCLVLAIYQRRARFLGTVPKS